DEFDNGISLEMIRDDAIVKSDLLFEDPARRLDDASFKLVDHPVWIDDQAGVGCTPNAMQANILVNRKLNDNGGVRATIFVSGKGNSTHAARATRRVSV